MRAGRSQQCEHAAKSAAFSEGDEREARKPPEGRIPCSYGKLKDFGHLTGIKLVLPQTRLHKTSPLTVTLP